MLTDHERFNNIASGIQNIVVSAALIVGGIWTVTTFDVLRTARRAEQELKRLEQPAVDFIINETVVPVGTPEKRGLRVQLTAKNIGGRYVSLQLPPGHFTISAVDPTDQGSLTPTWSVTPTAHASIRGDKVDRRQSQGISSGTSRDIYYFVELPRPGLYYLTFTFPIPPDIEAELDLDEHDLGLPLEDRPGVWGVAKLVYVP